MGRAKYTADDYAAVIEAVRNGASLRKACEPEHLPSEGTVREKVDKDEAYAAQYARAREDRAEGIFEDILDIADDSKSDAQDRRVRIDARKWMLGKMQPKRYGEKVALEHTGEGGSALAPPVINVTVASPDA